MSKQANKYLLVSLPTNIALSNEHDEALTALRAAVSSDYGTTYPFRVPVFKIGSLDALVGQADELAKLTADAEAATNRIGESLSSLLGGDQEKIDQQKSVNDRQVDQYLHNFSWNKVKYRIDKPIGEIIQTLRKELAGTDNDVKSKMGQYNQTNKDLQAAQRKQTGNLLSRSLASVVNPTNLITDSEYLETHLVALPNSSLKEFYKTYESIVPMVVPRSAAKMAQDSETTLMAVTTFKKTSSEFVHKCREHRWTPRDFRGNENSREEEAKEEEDLSTKEKKLWGEALRLTRTGYSEAFMTWMHGLALRVFVEAVLRYGLPAEFVTGIIQTSAKLEKRAKHGLDITYSYLGGNAISRDKKGRVQKDDFSMVDQTAAAAGGEEYTPYVYYSFELV